LLVFNTVCSFNSPVIKDYKYLPRFVMARFATVSRSDTRELSIPEEIGFRLKASITGNLH